MKKIRIIATPPGFAPEHIREQWLGLEIPILGVEDPVEGLKKIRTGIENLGGYEVSAKDAIAALKAANKNEAVRFWEPVLSENLVFKKEVCELIEGTYGVNSPGTKERGILFKGLFFYNGKSISKPYHHISLSHERYIGL